MSVESFQEVPIEHFGGLCTQQAPADVPVGMSPDCQNVDFYPGGWRTRPGTAAAFAAMAGARITGLKSYVPRSRSQMVLALTDGGRLVSGSPGGALTDISSAMAERGWLKSTTAYGSEYMAFHDGKQGIDIPRQWDNKQFTRLSQEGPGAPPTSVTPQGVAVIAITAIARAANVVTVTTDGNHGFAADWRVTTSGVTDNSFDGTFHIATVPAPNQFTFAQDGPNAASAGGNVGGTLAWLIADPPAYQYPRYYPQIYVMHGLAYDFQFWNGTDDIYLPYTAVIATRMDKTKWAFARPAGFYDPEPLIEPWKSYVFPDLPTIIGGLMRKDNVVTCRLAAGRTHNLAPGAKVLVQNADNAGFNGAFTVTATPDTGTLKWDQDGDDFNSGKGTVEPAGSDLLAGGSRKLAVFFELDDGYWTKLSPPLEFTSYAGHKMSVAGIPTGPPNVRRRGIAITSADGASYWYLEKKMQLDDNTSTTLVMDFSDEELIEGVNVDYLQNIEVLNNPAGVLRYGRRLLWWGEENALPGMRNTHFCGGFSGGLPLGWTLATTGGEAEYADVVTVAAYKITGDGATAIRGHITQSVAVDAWAGVAFLEPNRAYKVRARIKRSAGLAAGRINIDMYSASEAIDSVGIQLTAANVSEEWTEYEGDILGEQSEIPSDLLLRIFADQTPTADQYFLVSEIRIIPADELVKTSYMRVSMIDEPATYDGQQGFLLVDEDNGQALRAAFRIRDFAYLVKEGSTFVTREDGQNEPYQWDVEEISATVGTPSIHGVDVGEGWAIIVDKRGPYLFRGGAISEEDRLSPEIQPTWDAMNWEGAGHTAWVRVDTANKRVFFGLPGPNASRPDRILMLDYKEGFGDPRNNDGVGRKWCPWTIPADSCEIVAGEVMFGSNDLTGNILQLESSATDDAGQVIDSYYDTAFLGGSGFGGKLFGYLVAILKGAGLVTISGARPNGTRVTFKSKALAANPRGDFETPLNTKDNRISFRTRVNALGAWVDCPKFLPYMKQDPWGPVEGR